MRCTAAKPARPLPYGSGWTTQKHTLARPTELELDRLRGWEDSVLEIGKLKVPWAER